MLVILLIFLNINQSLTRVIIMYTIREKSIFIIQMDLYLRRMGKQQ
nr:MAG TPA: hypothetical protein [Caudoviricetes sp.]